MDHSLQVDAKLTQRPERFAKSITEKPRFITATAKSLCWLIWSQAKKFQEVWDVSGNDLEFMRQPKKFHWKVRCVLFFINPQCLFTVLHVVKAVAGWCNEDEVEIVSFWFQSLPKFMYAPGTWKKHPKLSRNMRISPRCSGPVFGTIPAWSFQLTKNLHKNRCKNTHVSWIGRVPRFVWVFPKIGIPQNWINFIMEKPY